MGEKVLGIRLEGNPKNPEPEHFRVVLPFGNVDITRCTDNTYWVHIKNNRPDDGGLSDRIMGKFIDGRIDLSTKHTSDCNAGDFGHPDMYHMAVKIGESTVSASRKGD